MQQGLVIQQVIARAVVIGHRQPIRDTAQTYRLAPRPALAQLARHGRVARPRRRDVPEQGDRGGRQGEGIARAPGDVILHLGVQGLIDQALARILRAKVQADGDHQRHPAADRRKGRGDT